MGLKKYRLGDLVEVKRGSSLSGEYYATDGELMRLTLGHFDYQGGGFKDNTSKNDLYFTGPVKPEFILSEGDIITPLTEQTPGLLGSTAMIPESGKYIQSQDVALITPNESKLDRNFCYYLLPSVGEVDDCEAGRRLDRAKPLIFAVCWSQRTKAVISERTASLMPRTLMLMTMRVMSGIPRWPSERSQRRNWMLRRLSK